MNKRMIGILYVLLAAVSFGVMPVLAKLAYRGGANTYSVLFLRFLFATIILFCYLKYKKISIRLNKKQYYMVISLGTFGFSACSVTLFTAYRYISVGLASMILYTYPMLVTILCFFIYKEKIYSRKIFCLMLSLIGIYCLIGVKSEGYNVVGILLALTSAIVYSLYIIGISHGEVKKINSFVMSFYVSICACFVMLILGLGSRTLDVRFSASSFFCVLFLALISTVIALMAFTEGVRIIGASKASIFSTLEPIVSLFLGVLILGEKLTLQIAVGSMLVVISVIVLSMEEKSSTKS